MRFDKRVSEGTPREFEVDGNHHRRYFLLAHGQYHIHPYTIE